MLKTVPVILGATALVYLGLFIKDVEIPTVLPVEDVVVIGELRFLDRDEIINIVKNEIDGGYFTVNLNAVRTRLMQQPWIEKVSLRRQWPATLDVTVSEQTPIAYWNKDGYINDSGKVFKPEKINQQLNLPKLNGPEGHHNNVWKFMNALYQEMALLDFEVVQLDLDDRRSWQMVVSRYENADDGVQQSVRNIDIKLGRFDTEKRLKRFVRILPALTAGHNFKNKALTNKMIKVIDMRYPNGFAVQMIEA